MSPARLPPSSPPEPFDPSWMRSSERFWARRQSAIEFCAAVLGGSSVTHLHFGSYPAAVVLFGGSLGLAVTASFVRRHYRP